MLMLIATPGASDRTVTANASSTVWGDCDVDEVAVFVGTSIAGVMRYQVPRAVRKLAQTIASRKRPARPGTPSTATVTVGTESNDDKVTIDGSDIVVKASASTEGQVTHGATPAATAVNLVAKIHAHSVISTKVSAEIDGSVPEKVNLSSVLGNVGQDALTLEETGSTFTISGATFGSGASLVNIYSLTDKQSPHKFALNKRAIATAVTETQFGIAIGDTAWRRQMKSGAFIALIESILAYYKRVYLVDAA